MTVSLENCCIKLYINIYIMNRAYEIVTALSRLTVAFLRKLKGFKVS